MCDRDCHCEAYREKLREARAALNRVYERMYQKGANFRVPMASLDDIDNVTAADLGVAAELLWAALAPLAMGEEEQYTEQKKQTSSVTDEPLPPPQPAPASAARIRIDETRT